MIYLFGINSVSEFIEAELRESGELDIKFLVEEAFVATAESRGKPFSIFEAVGLEPDDVCINCIGYSNLAARRRVGEILSFYGVLGTFVSRRASVDTSSTIGPGSVLLGDVVVERGVRVGNHCLLWGGSRVCHNSLLGSGVFLASGVVVGGNSRIGDLSAVGFNAVVRDGAEVPNESRIRALTYFGRRCDNHGR